MARIEDLQDLAKAVSLNKIKNIQIIGNPGNTNTIFDEFYDLLVQGHLKNDTDFCTHFYDTPTDSKAYYKLKDRLEERLINTFFFIDIQNPQFSDIQKAFYLCYKNSVAVRLLNGKGFRKVAVRLAEKTIKKSLHFSFTSITIDLARVLMFHYGNISGDRKKFEHYLGIINKQFKILKHELKVEQYYAKIYVKSANSNALSKEMVSRVHKFVKKLNKHKNKYVTYRSYYLSNLIYLLDLELNNKWTAVIAKCNEIEESLKKNPRFHSPIALGLLLLHKLQSYLILRDFQNGEKLVVKCSEMLLKDRINWLYLQHLSLVMSIHAQKFEQAKETLDLALDHISTGSNFPLQIEIWKINEAFITYLISIGKIRPIFSQNGKSKSTFRLARFLNQVPIYSKDKRGSNITILILQILFLLKDRKYDVIIDRAESLKTYTQRHLKDDETFRSNCFIKMLLCLPEASFNKEKTIEKAQKYIDLLHSVPIEKAKQSTEIEVIPYEMLWEFVVETLD